MRFFSTLFFFLLFLPFFLFSMTLKEKIIAAQDGDYLVTLYDRTYTLFHIIEVTVDLIVIEEVSISQIEWKEQGTDWKSWLQKGGIGNQSWVVYELDLKTANILEYYSLTRKGWLDVLPQENFISSLFNLEFKRVPDEKRRKIGREPSPGAIDVRRNWNPPLYFEGKKLSKVEYEVWKTRWNKDESPLSNKEIHIYLPEGKSDLPSYYPYWLQVSNDFAKAHIRVVDSGRNMKSSVQEVPKRSPIFIQEPLYQNGLLTLIFRVSSSFKQFSVYAYSKQLGFDVPIILEGFYEQLSPNEWKVTVNKEELRGKLQLGCKYTFVLAVEGYTENFIETRIPFLWN